MKILLILVGIWKGERWEPRQFHRGGGGAGGSLKSEQKQTRGRGGVLAYVYVRFFEKNAEIFKMKFYSYSPVFPIDYNGSIKY